MHRNIMPNAHLQLLQSLSLNETERQYLQCWIINYVRHCENSTIELKSIFNLNLKKR